MESFRTSTPSATCVCSPATSMWSTETSGGQVRDHQSGTAGAPSKSCATRRSMRAATSRLQRAEVSYTVGYRRPGSQRQRSISSSRPTRHDAGSKNRYTGSRQSHRSRKLVTGTVSTTYWASQLSQKLAYALARANPTTRPGCTSSAQCVFPNASIPSCGRRRPPGCCNTSRPPTSAGTYFPIPRKMKTLSDNKAAARIGHSAKEAARLTTSSISTPWTIRIPLLVGRRRRPGLQCPLRGRGAASSIALTRSWGANTVNEATSVMMVRREHHRRVARWRRPTSSFARILMQG